MDDRDRELAELRARLQAAELDGATANPAASRGMALGGDPHAFKAVDPGLAFGIFIVPWIFVWFLLEAGYSIRSRIAGFLWLGAYLFVGADGFSGALNRLLN